MILSYQKFADLSNLEYQELIGLWGGNKNSLAVRWRFRLILIWCSMNTAIYEKVMIIMGFEIFMKYISKHSEFQSATTFECL